MLLKKRNEDTGGVTRVESLGGDKKNGDRKKMESRKKREEKWDRRMTCNEEREGRKETTRNSEIGGAERMDRKMLGITRRDKK